MFTTRDIERKAKDLVRFLANCLKQKKYIMIQLLEMKNEIYKTSME